VNRSNQSDKVAVITLLALIILKQKFMVDRDEWMLIERKAKKFVRSANIDDRQITQKIEKMYEMNEKINEE